MADEDDGEAGIELNLDAGDPDAHRRRRTKVALRGREKERFWQAVFASEVGRAEMWAVLTLAGTFDNRFGVGPNGFPQPEVSWFNMGQKALGLRLYREWLALAQEGVVLMQAEHDKEFARPKMPQTKRDE